VQFNIFYPDLIDIAKAPTYKIVKEDGNDDTVLLYFTAGPPYEDIAFRIVNREWEYSHKRYQPMGVSSATSTDGTLQWIPKQLRSGVPVIMVQFPSKCKS
jgi:cobalamin biosynthesis protein CobD/CbiB